MLNWHRYMTRSEWLSMSHCPKDRCPPFPTEAELCLTCKGRHEGAKPR